MENRCNSLLGKGRVLSVAFLSLAFLSSANGCSSSKSDSGSLSSALCSDLESGYSIFQIYQGVRDRYTPERFADLAYGWAATSCPSQLKTNEFFRQYLIDWGINPDG